MSAHWQCLLNTHSIYIVENNEAFKLNPVDLSKNW